MVSRIKKAAEIGVFKGLNYEDTARAIRNLEDIHEPTRLFYIVEGRYSGNLGYVLSGDNSESRIAQKFGVLHMYLPFSASQNTVPVRREYLVHLNIPDMSYTDRPIAHPTILNELTDIKKKLNSTDFRYFNKFKKDN